MKRNAMWGVLAAVPAIALLWTVATAPAAEPVAVTPQVHQVVDQDWSSPVSKSDTQWKEELSPDQYKILRQCGTEPPFSSPLLKEKREGTFVCAACGQKLFPSEAKFESGTGWPSFWKAVDDSAINIREDRAHGMVRTELICSNCSGHLGHVFDDGPAPTGQRYCINGVALKFEAKE